jgi:hypothetical protein
MASDDVFQYVYVIAVKRLTITQPIVIPDGGFLGNITFSGYGNNLTEIYSNTPNIDLFVGDGITTGGNLFFNNLRFTSEGIGSRIFNIKAATPFAACEFVNINFEVVEDIGIFDGFRQGLLLNGFYFDVKKGFLFRGTWGGGFRVTESRLLATTGCPYNFKSDVGHTFGSRFVTNANTSLDAATIGFDFREDTFIQDGDFQLLGAQFDGAGTPVKLPINGGLDGTSVKALFRDCRGIRDTFEGVVFDNQTATTTPIQFANTYYELEVDNLVVEQAWFASQSLTNFDALYISSLDSYIRIDLFLSLQGGNNDTLEVEIRKYDSTNTTFTALRAVTLTSNGGTLGDRVEPVTIPIVTNEPITLNERIRVFVRNNSSNKNILCEEGSTLIISKR